MHGRLLWTRWPLNRARDQATLASIALNGETALHCFDWGNVQPWTGNVTVALRGR